MTTATSTSGSTKKSTKMTLAAWATFFGTLGTVILAKLTSAKAVTLNGVATTWGAVAAVFQAFPTAFTSATTTKQAYSKAVASEKAALAAAKAQLKAFTTWAVSQYGDAAYEMFGLTAPAAKAARSTVSKAVSTTKANATKQAKKAALKSITPATDEENATAALTTLVAPASTPAPAATPATPPAKS